MLNHIEMKDIVMGRAKRYRDITVFPLDRKLVEVTEVDAAGSVPELLVINRSKRAVLIIDGEEVVGAKQNRVVNTSLLLPAESTTKIPMSCTEAGRWGRCRRSSRNRTPCRAAAGAQGSIGFDQLFDV